MIDLGKKNLLGVNIHAVDYEAAVAQIIQAARDGQPFGVSALAVHGVMTGVMHSTHRHRLNQLELIVADGQPVRWGLNALHSTRLPDRVYGPTLMLETCAAAAEQGLPIFLFGSTETTLQALEANLTTRFPGLQVAGKRASEFRTISAHEKKQLVQQIRASGAAMTFVGLGCPRQEVWAYEFREALSMPVLAVGAAFAFHAGQLRQAPSWMQRAGLEWMFRLFAEPKRLWKRYLLLNPYFLFLLGLQWTGLRRFDVHDTLPPTNDVLYG